VKRFKKINNQNGSALVEFAFVLPLLLIIVFGIIEFGVMFYDKAVITNASREGARAGITGVANSDIEDIVKDYCKFNLINLSNNDFDPAADPYDDISISKDDSSIDGSKVLTVRLEYRYDLLLGSIFKFYTPYTTILNTTISAETVMRMEKW
jgi:hypothetical protein